MFLFIYLITLSTGKEANVYHSTTNNSTNDLAVKIYKTSILTFKDRDKYVTGEFRFRHGYCRSNPRKMVRTWAEKEFRNLSRYFFYFKYNKILINTVNKDYIVLVLIVLNLYFSEVMF